MFKMKHQANLNNKIHMMFRKKHHIKIQIINLVNHKKILINRKSTKKVNSNKKYIEKTTNKLKKLKFRILFIKYSQNSIKIKMVN